MALLHLQQCLLVLLSIFTLLRAGPVLPYPASTNDTADTAATVATTQQQHVEVDEGEEEEEEEEEEECPQPLCADTTFDGTCHRCTERSRCRFQGCVFSNQNGVVWMPDHCTTCYCDRRKRPVCHRTYSCLPEIRCYGYPKVTYPGQCCPRCIYGVKQKECGYVPRGHRILRVEPPDNSDHNDTNNNNNNNNKNITEACQVEVVDYDCHRGFYYILEDVDTGNGTTELDIKWFLCDSVREEVVVPVEGCPYGDHVTYTAVTACQERHETDPRYLPLFSSSSSSSSSVSDSSSSVGGSSGCSFYVPAPTAMTTTTTTTMEDQETTTEEELTMESGEHA